MSGLSAAVILRRNANIREDLAEEGTIWDIRYTQSQTLPVKNTQLLQMEAELQGEGRSTCND